METFSNPIVLPGDLPEIDSLKFNPLDRRQLTISLVRIAIVLLVVVGASVVVLLLSEGNIPNPLKMSIGLFITIIFILSAVHTILAFPKKGYLVRDNDISFQRGLFTYKLTTVPFNRIQHVEINQGVIAKLFSLSTLKLYTAGGNSSDLSIRGLPEEVAGSIKTFLSKKISEHKID